MKNENENESLAAVVKGAAYDGAPVEIMARRSPDVPSRIDVCIRREDGDDDGTALMASNATVYGVSRFLVTILRGSMPRAAIRQIGEQLIIMLHALERRTDVPAFDTMTDHEREQLKLAVFIDNFFGFGVDPEAN